MSSSVESIVALSALGISGKKWDQILWHGGAEYILNHQPDIIFSKLLEKKQISFDFDRQNLLLKKALHHTLGIQYFLKTGGQILGVNGPHELGNLNRADSPVLCAYLRGNRNLIRQRPALAIVGTRNPSEKGKNRAFETAFALSKKGCLIVSGGANGVDLCAHEGALSADAETLVVLGEPLLANKDERPFRIRNLKPNSLVTTLTTFGPWIPTNRSLFVTRNQYVAALADALVIIEGTIDSGTLHTARFAKKMNVPIWVIPGDPDNPLAGAANLLLQEGEAKALFNYETLFQSLGIKENKPIEKPQECLKLPKASVSFKQLPVTPIMDFFIKQNGRVTLDLLCDQFEKPISVLQKDLLELELMGKIRKEGSEFVLIDA